MILSRTEMRQSGCPKLHTGGCSCGQRSPQPHRARWSMEIYQKRRLSRYPLFCGGSCRDVFVRARKIQTRDDRKCGVVAFRMDRNCSLRLSIWFTVYPREKSMTQGEVITARVTQSRPRLIAALHMIWPVAALGLATIVTGTWIAFLAFGIYRLIF